MNDRSERKKEDVGEAEEEREREIRDQTEVLKKR